MSRLAMKALAAATLLVGASVVHAQSVLIKNATVHTATAQGTLQNADVLVRDGVRLTPRDGRGLRSRSRGTISRQ